MIKGYNVDAGYMGWIGDRYMLFACERDYKEWMEIFRIGRNQEI